MSSGSCRRMATAAISAPAIGARAVDLAYLTQIAQAADELGYFGVLLPTGKQLRGFLGRRLALWPADRAAALPGGGAAGPAVAGASRRAWRPRFDRLSGGRLLINVVTGGDPVELKGDGLFLDHDERYEVTDEFLTIWRGAARRRDGRLRGQALSASRAARLFFPPVQQPYPPLYFGGSSDGRHRGRGRARRHVPDLGRAAGAGGREDRRRARARPRRRAGSCASASACTSSCARPTTRPGRRPTG